MLALSPLFYIYILFTERNLKQTLTVDREVKEEGTTSMRITHTLSLLVHEQRKKKKTKKKRKRWRNTGGT